MRCPRPVRLSLPLAIGCTLAVRLGAQTLAPPRFEDQVVVISARTDTTIAQTPAFVTLIDAKDIELSAAQDIPDLLRSAGVQVTDVTGNRRSYRVDLRGFGATSSSNTLVLVDGRRVTQPDLSGTDWSQIPLHRVSRIEILRGGGGAVAFGDSASGGVINIITTDSAPAGRNLRLRGGAYSTLASEGSFRGVAGRTTYAVSGGLERSAGHRENAQTGAGDLGGGFVLNPTDSIAFSVTTGFHRDKTGLPGALTETQRASGVLDSVSATPDDFADVDDGYIMATPRLTLGQRGYALVDVSVRQRDSQFFSSFAGGEYSGRTGTRTVALSPKAVWPWAIGMVRSTLVAGVDLTSSSQDIRNTVVYDGAPSLATATLSKTGRGGYVRHESSAGRLGLNAGYRYDAAVHTFSPSDVRERRLHAHAADVGGSLRANAGVSFFASASQSFRYPVLDELFDFFSNSIVTGLTPQRSTGLDVGVRLQSGPARVNVALFRSMTRAEIFFNPIGGSGFGANENLDGRSRRVGVEVSASTVVQGVTVGGTYTGLEVGVDGGRYDGQSMPGVAPRRASIHAQIPVGAAWSVGLDGTYTGPRRFEGDFDGLFGEQEAVFVLDAKVSHRRGRARWFVDIKNLLDREYSEFGVLGGFPAQRAWYPSPGIHAIAGVDMTF